jgi:hypothetical protein
MVTCLVDSFFVLFLFVFDNKTTIKLATQDDLCVPITVLSALTASPFHFPFLLYLVTLSWTTLADT